MAYFLWVYEPSDFVTALPDENDSGRVASGGPTWQLTLADDAAPVVVYVEDDDDNFDEVDESAPQVLRADVEIDGVTYTAGTTITTAYDLVDTATGLTVTTIHFGNDGYGTGPVQGAVSSSPLKAGETYTFDASRTSNKMDIPYEGEIACFAAGTRIAVPGGEVPVEDLRPGMEVLTLDKGPMPLIWTGRRSCVAESITVPTGVLGARRPLVLSLQHRLLLSGAGLTLAAGIDEGLASAKHVSLQGPLHHNDARPVEWHHFACATHQIVWAEGVLVETLLPRELERLGFTASDRARLQAAMSEDGAQPARPIVTRAEAIMASMALEGQKVCGPRSSSRQGRRARQVFPGRAIASGRGDAGDQRRTGFP